MADTLLGVIGSEIPRRYLVATGLLIGAVSGLMGSVGLALLSGAPLFATTHGALVSQTAPPPSGTVSTLLPVAGGLESGSVPTSQPTAVPTSQPTAVPTAQPTARPIAVKLGRPTEGGTYGATVPVAALGQYITWRVIIDAADAGKAFDVEVATRLEGSWTGWSKLTSRVADARGTVVFSWRQRTPAWIRVRFALPTGPSRALQGRWR